MGFAIIEKVRKMKAVWWQRSATPDRYGKFSFEGPVEIDCRWDERTQEFVDSQGERLLSSAVVMVDRVMAPGDRLKRGEMDSDTPDDPLTIRTAFEIKRLDRIPTLKADKELLMAYL